MRGRFFLTGANGGELSNRCLELFGSIASAMRPRDRVCSIHAYGDLNLPRERYSLGVRKGVAIEAVKNSFDETVEGLERTTGAHVPKRQAEELVNRAAIDFEAFYDQDTVIPEPQESGDLLVLSVDGKGVVMREEDLRASTQKAAQKRKQKLESKLSKGEKKGSKRMATVAAVYTIEPFERTPEQVYANIMQRLRLVELKRPRPEHLSGVGQSSKRTKGSHWGGIRRSLASRPQPTKAMDCPRRWQ